MAVTTVLRKWTEALRGPRPIPPVPAPSLPVVFPPQPNPAATTKAAVDAYLSNLSAQIRAANPAPIRSIMISGTLRCGKTLVAQEVCARTGMVHMPTDRIRNATYLASDGPERARLVKYIHKRLLLMHPTGLVLEGTVFLDHGVTLAVWAKSRGFHVFAIGYALDDIGRKARSLIAFRRKNDCWTNGRNTDAELRRMARRIVARSRDIRSYCAAHGLTYLDLDSGVFHKELQRVRRVILRKMGLVRPNR